MSLLEFDHRKDRRSLSHRYAEMETEVKEMATAALQNEQVTRGRVQAIEGLLSRSFWGRLRWLLTGR
jgi:hypothetical protein